MRALRIGLLFALLLILAAGGFVLWSQRNQIAATQRPPANALPFPLNQRWIVAFWNLLYFDDAPYRADPRQSTEWNRGAYLVDGLGHCGDCHTPRNLLGAEKDGEALAGGEAEGWSAPALNASSPAPVPWDASHLFAYLRRGWDAEHG